MKKHLFGFAGMVLATAGVSACSFPVSSLEHQVEKAEEIFIANLLEAKIIPIDDHHKWPSIEGKFLVKKTLKGDDQPKVVILTTGFGRSDCGVPMLVSWNYVIFKGSKDTGIRDPSGTHVIEDFQVEDFSEKIRTMVSKKNNKPR